MEKKEDKEKIEDGKKLEELKKKLEEYQKQKEEYLAGWQRERADFLNYKKEEMERIKGFLAYAGEEFVLKILPILDNFEVVEKKLPEDLKKDESVKGILQIKKQILDFLKSQGVEEIKSMGEKFDPNLHEAVENVPSDLSTEAQRAEAEASAKEGEKLEPGTIIEEVQKGYKINGELLRPAKVKIAK
jgi:molecular chaperone GrpE